MREHFFGCLITGIVIVASAAWAQPVRFQIGAYGVSNTASLTAGNARWDTLPNPGDDRHRIEDPGSEMDATAWGMLHDLHLTMPFFKVRSNQVNVTFPKTNLIAATRGNGFNAAISDDSVYLNFRRSERRVYPSKDTSI